MNTALLKTELKYTMMETETVRDLMAKISSKIGDSFMNKKQYVLLPVYKNEMPKMRFLPEISKYGGITTA